MKLFLTYSQIISAIILTFLIVIQTKEGGLAGLNKSTSYHSKKGLEKVILTGTIIVAITFVILSLVNAFLIS